MSYLDKMTRQDALAIMGLNDGASDADIRDAYKRLVKITHPDANGTNGLFCVMTAANAILTGKTTAAAPEPAKKSPTPKKPTRTWTDIISQPDFNMPWPAFESVFLRGHTEAVNYRGTTVRIRPEDLFSHFIATSFPVTIQILSWGSPLSKWLSRFTGKKPEVIASRDLRCKNWKPDFGSTLMSSGEFNLGVFADIAPGCYEAVFRCFGKEFRECAIVKRGQDQRKTVQFSAEGADKIILKINVELSIDFRCSQ